MNTSPPLARTIDAAILKPELDRSSLIAALETCLEYNVWSACVRPADIPTALSVLKNSTTSVCAVLAFPHGTCLSRTKADEARALIDEGVHEIDMVANFSAALSSDWNTFREDVAAVIQPCRSAAIPLKVILETCFFRTEAIHSMTRICTEEGADFVKTSTGFNGPGAAIEAVSAMLAAAVTKIRVKASGGIRDVATAENYLRMGVSRLGVGYTSLPALCGNAGGAGDGATY